MTKCSKPTNCYNNEPTLFIFTVESNALLMRSLHRYPSIEYTFILCIQTGSFNARENSYNHIMSLTINYVVELCFYLMQ